MYIAELLNSHGLFQSISGLIQNNTEQRHLSEFLFRATSVVIHLERILQLHTMCLSEYRIFAEDLAIRRKRIVFASPNVVGMVNEIPPLLNTLRIMQDMVLPLFARASRSKFSVASSLSDAVKNLHGYSFPEKVKKRTLMYWTSSGRHLKDYRDLDQHYRTIATRVLLEYQPKLQMLILLPDNPTAKKESGFTYWEERNALIYIPHLFKVLHDWVEDLAHIMGATPSPIQTYVETEHLGNLTPPAGGTIALLVNHKVVDGIQHINAIEVAQMMDCRLQLRQLSKKIVPVQQDNPADA